MISPGVSTLPVWSGEPTSISASSESYGERVLGAQSWGTFIAVWWKAFSAPASLCGTPAALLLRGQLCRGWLKLDRELWGAAFLPPRTSTHHDARRVRSVSWRSPPILHTDCSSLPAQVSGWEASRTRPPGSEIISTLQLSEELKPNVTRLHLISFICLFIHYLNNLFGNWNDAFWVQGGLVTGSQSTEGKKPSSWQGKNMNLNFSLIVMAPVTANSPWAWYYFGLSLLGSAQLCVYPAHCVCMLMGGPPIALLLGFTVLSFLIDLFIYCRSAFY